MKTTTTKRKPRRAKKPVSYPQEFKNDPLPVKILLAASRRLNEMGNGWRSTEEPNPIAAEHAYRMGWAYALSARFLRERLKGGTK